MPSQEVTPLEAIIWIVYKEWLPSYKGLVEYLGKNDIFCGQVFSAGYPDGLKQAEGKKYPINHDIEKDSMLLFADHLAMGKKWEEEEWRRARGGSCIQDDTGMNQLLQRVLENRNLSLLEFVTQLQSSIANDKKLRDYPLDLSC